MKKQPALILSAVSCVLAGVCLFELHSVKQELQQVRSLNSQHYSSLQMCIDGISGTVSDKLEQQQNLLAKTGFSYGAVNAENATILLRYTATPKEFAPGSTTAEFHYNGTAVPMAYENGQFIAEAEIPIFSETGDAFITLQDGDTLRTQALSDYFSPQYQAFSEFYPSFNGSCEFVREDGSLKVIEKQPVTMGFPSGVPEDLKSISFTAELDRKEIDRVDVDLSENAQNEILRDPLFTNREDLSLHGENYYAVLDKSYTVPAGKTLRIFADVEYENGLLYRYLMDCVAADQNAEVSYSSQDEVDNFWGQPRYIYYAPTHKLLWDALLQVGE